MWKGVLAAPSRSCGRDCLKFRPSPVIGIVLGRLTRLAAGAPHPVPRPGRGAPRPDGRNGSSRLFRRLRQQGFPARGSSRRQRQSLRRRGDASPRLLGNCKECGHRWVCCSSPFSNSTTTGPSLLMKRPSRVSPRHPTLSQRQALVEARQKRRGRARRKRGQAFCNPCASGPWTESGISQGGVEGAGG